MKPLILSLLFVFAMPAFAGDKIGNGGGLWACLNGDQTLQSSVLVDFFELEAESRFKLRQPRSKDPMDIVDEVLASLRSEFPDYVARWESILSTVRFRIHLTNAELTVIDDSLWRVKPQASLCRTGWQYVQFANYNDDLKKVLIRKDLWESPLVSNVDKAGLVWHETIYRWMREQFGDKNSVRARQITGYLFSNAGPETKRTLVAEVLKQGGLDPGPQNPVFVCLINNRMTHSWFHDYGVNDMSACNEALKACQLGDPNEMFHCDVQATRFDSFISMEQKHSCAVKNRLRGTRFTETGRSPIEAEAKAREACAVAGESFHCEQQAECR